MSKKSRSHVEDLRGVSRLAVEATQGVTDLVQEMHRDFASGPGLLGRPLEAPTRLVTDLVYGSIRGITGMVGAGIDLALGQLSPLLGEAAPGPEREAVLSALNGVLGDYLAETDNPLAIEMQLRADAHPLPIDDPEALADTLPHARPHLLVMLPGLCMSDTLWPRNGHDHGAALVEDFGWTRIDLRYNSGLHISQNGRQLADHLDRLVRGWPVPVESIQIVAHSMGGLVGRSACRFAELAAFGWRNRLRSFVFLGTPHHGAPLERGGNWLELIVGRIPYARPLARLGRIRSAGVTDLRYGNVLDEHWEGRDRFEGGGDPRTPLPLPRDVRCYALAGSGGGGSGDGLVPIDSALGVHEDPDLILDFAADERAVQEGVGHMDLLGGGEVYAQIEAWLRARGD